MNGAEFKITKKKKKFLMACANSKDFSKKFSQSIHLQEMRRRKDLSLYSYGPNKNSFLFTDGLDLEHQKDHPFLYQAQYQSAHNIVKVPISSMDGQSEREAFSRQLIFIFSIGRAGSTLLNRLFHLIPLSINLSEPDIFFEMSNRRNRVDFKGPGLRNYLKVVARHYLRKGIRDVDLHNHINVATRHLFMGNWLSQASVRTIKFRSHSLNIADLFHSNFPEAKFVFLHRQADDWFRSSSKAFRLNSENLARQWNSLDASFRTQRNLGVPFIVLDYQKLIDNPLKAFQDLLSRCDIHSQIDPKQFATIMGRDSQEGSSISQSSLQKIADVDDDALKRFLKLIDFDNNSFFQD